jgi:pantoate--beta-alanine ligase
MGALHEGHASLIRRAVGLAQARGLSAGCVVSIFVNPTQFNDAEDFSRYPRTLDADLRVCEQAGAGFVFAPDRHAVYPTGQEVAPPPLPDVAVTPGLEDAHRPGHFAGVCQVVHRLFSLLRPDAAVFGEKDWQQLQVVRAMTVQQRLGVDIVPAPTVRSPDGLALSSRNALLEDRERRRALSLSRALAAAAGCEDVVGAESAMRRVMVDAAVEVEYAAARDAETLGPVSGPSRSGLLRPARILVAGRVGHVRLIDNAVWG